MYEFKVEGMTCPSCSFSISQAMKQVDGTSNVKIDLTKSLVMIKSNKSENELKSVLEEIGFPVLNSKKVS